MRLDGDADYRAASWGEFCSYYWVKCPAEGKMGFGELHYQRLTTGCHWMPFEHVRIFKSDVSERLNIENPFTPRVILLSICLIILYWNDMRSYFKHSKKYYKS